MYRSLFPVLLCTVAVTSAPQEGKNSDITYVKIQPVTDENIEPKSPFRESRIENLPLTIPGNVNANISEEQSETTERADFTVSRIHNKPDEVRKVNEDDVKPIENDEDVPVTKPSERKPVENQRRARSEDSTASYETDTVEPTGITESVEELIQQTEEYETRTKAPSPRFISKLSYFQKDNVGSSIATNLVERTGKRKFKSKCRCEKIWNCPKLQITVPRCPDEYFLCCF